MRTGRCLYAASSLQRRGRETVKEVVKIGAQHFSPPTPPKTVLLVARSMAVTIGVVCSVLGRQDALLMARYAPVEGCR